VTATSLIEEIDASLALARHEPDQATARVLIGAARSNLGRIDQRFSVPAVESDRTLLDEADGDLRSIQEALGTHRDQNLWKEWDVTWPARKRRLEADGPSSLFSNAVLKKR
jgi:hypothetical protein